MNAAPDPPAPSVRDAAPRLHPTRKRRVNAMFLGLCIAATASAVVVLIVLIASILVQGLPALDINFLTSAPSSDPDKAGFFYPIVGSLWILAVCALSSIPLGVGTALFLEEFRPKRGPLRLLHSIVQTNIRNLAGVPSVVYGLIGLTAFARMFGLFGTPLQYQQYTEIRTNDGAVYVGQLLPQEAPPLRFVAEGYGEVPVVVEGLPADAVETLIEQRKLALQGTIELNDEYEFIVRTDSAGAFGFSAFDVTTDMAYADPFAPEPVAFELVLPEGADIERAQNFRLLHPVDGLIEVPVERVGDNRAQRQRIDAVFVREHIFTLDDGGVVRGALERVEGDTITVERDVPGADGSEDITFDRASVAAYRTKNMWTFGDEDSPIYVRFPIGSAVLAGGLTLMLVVLPIVIIASQEAIRAVPGSLREGAAALGATRWQTVFRTVLPNAVPGILTGTILAMSRAIGETAPILVVGAATFVTLAPTNLMSDFSAMPLQIYGWTILQEALGFQPLAAAGIIVLLVILLSFNATAVLLRQSLQRNAN